MIVVAAIYLFECACWVRRDVLCLSTVLGRFRDLPSPSFMGNERNKLVPGNPSPLAHCFLFSSWPISLSPDGIYSPEAMRLLPGGEPTCHIGFDGIAGAIAAFEKEVRVDDRMIASCASNEQAQSLAETLREVAACSCADRGKIIGEHLDRWTDCVAVAERFAELKTVSAPLRISGLSVFVLAFVAGPALYYSPWPPSWIGVTLYFVLLFLTWMMTVWDYAVCRKRLLREKFSERFRHTGMLLLSPAAAMRASEALLRNGLAGFHPLAAAAALCTKERFSQLARPILLAVEHPMPNEVPSDPAACRIDAWFRKKLLKRLHSVLRRLEIDGEQLLRPADPLIDSQSYCPRCHNQFVLAAGTCPDCDGLALVPYSANSCASEGCGTIGQ